MTSPAAPKPAEGGFFARLLDRIGDRSNPILVRIVRQELRNRTFISLFLILLVAAVIAGMAVASVSDQNHEGQAGSLLFGILAIAWTFALVLVQPLGSTRAVNTERNEDTWDLVELTGMRPRTVITGLLVASLIQGMLYTAALAPFMVMAYLLRGIEISLIVFVLIVVPLIGVAASSLAVFCACLGNNKATRNLLASLLGLALLMFCFIMMPAMIFNPRELYGFLSLILGGSSEVWALIGAWLNAWLGFVVTMIVFSASLLTFRAANRSTAPRVLWYILWLNGLGWMFVVYGFGHVSFWQILTLFGFMGVIWSLPFGVFALSEDYDLSPRQAREITQAKTWRKPFMLFFGPGAARGRLAFLLMAGVSAALAGIGCAYDTKTVMYGPDSSEFALAAWAMLCYCGIILVIADGLYRGILARFFTTPPLRRGFMLLVTAIFTLVPLLLMAVIDLRLIENSAWAYLSPAGGLIRILKGDSLHEGALIGLSLVGVGAMAVLALQGLRLSIHTQRVSASEADRNPRA